MALNNVTNNDDILIETNKIIDEVNNQDTTIVQHGNLITELFAKLGLISDYVIESGSNENGWTWKKWHSGEIELWFSKSFIYDIDTAYQGFFYNSVPIAVGSYPVALTSLHNFQFSYINANIATFFMVANSNTITNTNGGSYSMYRHAVTSNANTNVSCYYKGRWK